MHRLSILFAAAILAVNLPVAAATLSVAFVQPERYVDASYWSASANERDRAEVQRDIERHLQRLAERHLAAGERLEIEVLDIDLAGRFEPFLFRNGYEPRIVRDITWPRIKLRYTLTRGDQVVTKAEEQLADMNYLQSINRYSSGDRLRYEKAMLDEWFDRRIGAH